MTAVPESPRCELCGRPATWFAGTLGFCATCEATFGLDECLRLVTRGDRPAPDPTPDTERTR